MATYIGYKERDKIDHVDWTELGKDMTDMLSKEGERRDKLRADIAQQSRDYANKIATAEQSNHTGLNEWWLDYGGQASDALLQLDRLFQSGQLKQKDYLAMRQNLMDGTDQALDLVENFSTLYDERMKRLNDGTSSWMEHEDFAELEGFMNFTNSRLSIDPSSYKVGLGFMDENGKPIKDNRTIADLYNRVNATRDKYDLAGNLKTTVSQFAKKYQTANGIHDDIRKHPDFDEIMDNYIDAMLSSPQDAASIYGDYMDGDTSAVAREWDPASGMYKYTLNDEQMGEVRDFLRKQIDSGLPKGQRYVDYTKDDDGGGSGDKTKVYNREKLIDKIQTVYSTDFEPPQYPTEADGAKKIVLEGGKKMWLTPIDKFNPDVHAYAKPKSGSGIETAINSLIKDDLMSSAYYEYPIMRVDGNGVPKEDGEYITYKEDAEMIAVIRNKDGEVKRIPLGPDSFSEINKALNIGETATKKVSMEEFDETDPAPEGSVAAVLAKRKKQQ